MDAKLVQAVRVRLEPNTTDELLRLWKENDLSSLEAAAREEVEGR